MWNMQAEIFKDLFFSNSTHHITVVEKAVVIVVLEVRFCRIINLLLRAVLCVLQRQNRQIVEQQRNTLVASLASALLVRQVGKYFVGVAAHDGIVGG